MSEHYCMYKDGMCELDVDEAYQQGRADAINECIEALGNNFWDIAKLEQLKENKE